MICNGCRHGLAQLAPLKSDVRPMNRTTALSFLNGAVTAHVPLFVVPAVLLWSVISAAGQSSPPDYPQWRGQNRDGAASGFSEPTSWPDHLTRQWKVEVGEGYGTPLVVGDTVYVFTRRGGDEVITALHAATGQIVWQSGYPAPYVPGSPAAAHGAGPKATPAFHEGKLFTLGISGIVAAFDGSSGDLLWSTPEPSEHPYFSAASSPVAEGGVVIVHPGNYGPLTAFDANTGIVQWTAGEGGFLAISEFPKWRKYLISLSFRDKSSVRPVQVGGFEANIVFTGRQQSEDGAVHPLPGSHLVAHGRALWKLTAPWTHRTRPPRLGKRCVFSTSFHRDFPIESPTQNPERPQNGVGKPG